MQSAECRAGSPLCTLHFVFCTLHSTRLFGAAPHHNCYVTRSVLPGEVVLAGRKAKAVPAIVICVTLAAGNDLGGACRPDSRSLRLWGNRVSSPLLWPGGNKNRTFAQVTSQTMFAGRSRPRTPERAPKPVLGRFRHQVDIGARGSASPRELLLFNQTNTWPPVCQNRTVSADANSLRLVRAISPAIALAEYQ